jgi:hypothetical protein
MDMNQIPKAGFQYGKVANHTETASEDWDLAVFLAPRAECNKKRWP